MKVTENLLANDNVFLSNSDKYLISEYELHCHLDLLPKEKLYMLGNRVTSKYDLVFYKNDEFYIVDNGVRFSLPKYMSKFHTLFEAIQHYSVKKNQQEVKGYVV